MKRYFTIANIVALVASVTVLTSVPQSPVLSLGGGTPAYMAGTWERMGGPPGGIGYDIRMRPDNPDIMYVTDVNSGLNMSTDGGHTWFPSNTGMEEDIPPGAIGAPIFSCTVNPHDPNIVYAGTQILGHLYRSTDGGYSWQRWDNGVETYGRTIRGITVDPNDPNVLYLGVEVESFIVEQEYPGNHGTRGEVYKSVDGGQNWFRIWEGENLARYVWVDPRNSNRIYVSTGIFDRGAFNANWETGDPGGVGILRSDDGGQTWTVLNENNGLGGRFIPSLYMHPTNPDILIAAVGMQGPQSGVYVTYDGGDTWQPAMLAEQGETEAVEISETNPNIWYAAGEGVFFRSDDAGQTWQRFRLGSPDRGPGVPIDLQVDPRNPYRVFVNNYGGGNFLSEDGGETWVDASRGYTGAEMKAIGVAPWSSSTVYASANTGFFRSDDGGYTWVGAGPVDHRPGPGWGMLFYSSRAGAPPTDMMVASGGTIWISHDGGNSWQDSPVANPEFHVPPAPENPSGLLMTNIRAMAVSPANPGYVYVAFATGSCLNGLLGECGRPSPGFFRSRDGGATWEHVQSPFDTVGAMDMVADPNDPLTVYAGAGDGLYITHDGGDSWQRLQSLDDFAATGPPPDPDAVAWMGHPGVIISSIVFDPTNPQYIYLGTFSHAVVRSTDGGQTWEVSAAGMDPNEPIHRIVADPNVPGLLYAASGISGVFFSTDYGTTWQRLADGLYIYTVFDLALSPDGSVLYASTDGNGVYRLGTP